jgi:hypothetical protein
MRSRRTPDGAAAAAHRTYTPYSAPRGGRDAHAPLAGAFLEETENTAVELPLVSLNAESVHDPPLQHFNHDIFAEERSFRHNVCLAMGVPEVHFSAGGDGRTTRASTDTGSTSMEQVSAMRVQEIALALEDVINECKLSASIVHTIPAQVDPDRVLQYVGAGLVSVDEARKLLGFQEASSVVDVHADPDTRDDASRDTGDRPLSKKAKAAKDAKPSPAHDADTPAPTTTK